MRVEVLDASNIRQAGRPSSFADALASWRSDGTSNLLVVMGRFGTGKTTALETFATDPETTLLSFASMATSNDAPLPKSNIVILDNFDAVNTLTGFQVGPPDLRKVSHLAKTKRVVLATRRSPLQADDEFVGQLMSRQRYAVMGFRSPTVLHVIPWQVEELREHVNRLAPRDETLNAVVSYLGMLHPHGSEQLRTPLLINMLATLASALRSFEERPTLANIYEKYCDFALAKDYDLQRSQIPRGVKTNILSDLAYDIFSGIVPDLGAIPALSLPVARVSERVLESLENTPAFRQHAGFDRYEWTEDFLQTNHVFDRLEPPRMAAPEPLYGFVHESFYEYFVGVALCKSIAHGLARPFSLDIDKMANVDSLVFAFTKESGGLQLRQQVRRIVARPHLTIADRLILLYLLEDETDFDQLLASVPSGYLDDLLRHEPTVPSFFLKKMIRYQLVVAGRYEAADYVAEIRRSEDERGLQAEVRLLSTEQAVTQQLLSRLYNGALERARLITLFRLGQFGDRTAIEPLRGFAAAASASLAEEARNAIAAIEARQGDGT